MSHVGAPEGNTISSSINRLWGDTIRRAAIQSDGARLRKIAEKMLDMAEAGDMGAIKELGDRIDGKVPQGLNLGGADGGALTVILASADASL